jgi:hypothetical protein
MATLTSSREDVIAAVLILFLHNIFLHLRSNAADWLVLGLSSCIKCKHTAAP